MAISCKTIPYICRMNFNTSARFFSTMVIPAITEFIMHRTKQSIKRTATKPKQHDQHSTKVFIPYYPHVNKQVKNILHRHSLSTACTSNKSLRDLLTTTSTKSRQPVVNTSNVIYQIPCKDCLSTY